GEGGELGRDVLHGVVDGQARGDGARGRVDVEEDVLLRIFGFEEEELRHDQVRDVVGDRGAEEDYPVAQEPRVDVVGALAATGLLDDDGDEVRLHRRGPALGRDSTGFDFQRQLLQWSILARSLRLIPAARGHADAPDVPGEPNEPRAARTAPGCAPVTAPRGPQRTRSPS